VTTTTFPSMIDLRARGEAGYTTAMRNSFAMP